VLKFEQSEKISERGEISRLKEEGQKAEDLFDVRVLKL
jgi:hypothetical protein